MGLSRYLVLFHCLSVAACSDAVPPAPPESVSAVATATIAAPSASVALDDLDEKLRHCPLTVDGAEVDLQDAHAGVALTIVSETDAGRDEIRRRAAHLASFSKGGGRDKHGGGKGGGFMRNCPVVTKHTTIVAEDVPNGATLVVAPVAPLDIAALRKESRDRLERLPLARAEALSSDNAAGEVRYYSASLADLDGDQHPELIAGGFRDEEEDRRSTVPVFTSQAGKWQRLTEFGWSDGRGSTIRNVAVADLDGDGRDEIVALGRVGAKKDKARARLAVLGLKDKDLKPSAVVEWGDVVYTHGYGLDVGDVDGDGRLDIVTGGFAFDGKEETGFVRVWRWTGKTLELVAEIKLRPADGDGDTGVADGDADRDEPFASMRVNSIAVGDLDGGLDEIVVAGRRGPLKPEDSKSTHRDRREQGDLTVLSVSSGKLVVKARLAFRAGTTTRLRTVVVADLDGDKQGEIVAAGQYDREGRPYLALLRLKNGALQLEHDASPKNEVGEIKHLFVDGTGAAATLIATGPIGAKPGRQGIVEGWKLRADKLQRESTMTSKNGDETRTRAAVVLAGPGGSTVVTVGHALTGSKMVGQVLAWKLPTGD